MNPNTDISLSEKTLRYWNLSCTYNSRPSQFASLTTEKAITLTNTTLAYLNPSRPLADRLRVFQEAVIIGTRKRKQTASATVVQLRALS